MAQSDDQPSNIMREKESKADIASGVLQRYQEIINEAREHVGYGTLEGAFHEEWDAQLLIKCGEIHDGHQLVIFVPAFLRTILDDTEELDLAFKFLLLAMDGIAMRARGRYIFVYCFLGLDWAHPELAKRLRLALDILPSRYSKNAKRIYILHPSMAFRFSLWTFSTLISKRVWDKIEHLHSLDEICRLCHPDDPQKRADLRRCFPLAVHRRDAEIAGLTPPATFGMTLKHLCTAHGVDFKDRTTGKSYPNLPPPIIFLCETMEREGAEEDFFSMFNTDYQQVCTLVGALDQGQSIPRDMPGDVMWCTLKLFVDCLSSPLLTFKAFDDLQAKAKVGDKDAQRQFLIELLHNTLPPEAAYVSLYLSSFLHTMCDHAARRDAALREAGSEGDGAPLLQKEVLTPQIAAKLFTPCFLRPRVLSQKHHLLLPYAESLVEMLIVSAENPEFWIAKPNENQKGTPQLPDGQQTERSKDDPDATPKGKPIDTDA